jgi:hypothetical protein
MKRSILKSTAIVSAMVLAGTASAQDVRVRLVGFAIQWPRCGFEARFLATTLTATIEDYGQNSLNVEVDGNLNRLDVMHGGRQCYQE